MSNTINITCPISAERVDENTARVIAGYIVIATTISLLLNGYVISSFLALDFAIRAFSNLSISPVRRIGIQISKVLNLPKKPTDAAPKKFAAALGFVFALSIAVLQISGLHTAAIVLGALLITCASLEAAFGFCVGCVIYSLLILPILKTN